MGYGSDITILEVAHAIGSVVGYSGEIVFDSTKPDGAPRKLIDSGLLKRLGWQAKINIETGLKLAYADFLNQIR